MKLKVIGYVIGSLGIDFTDLEPSGCGIYHCQTVEFDLFVLLRVFIVFPDSVWTYQVDTQGVPRNVFCHLGWKFAQLRVPFLADFTCGASLTCSDNVGAQSAPVVMLSQGEL